MRRHWDRTARSSYRPRSVNDSEFGAGDEVVFNLEDGQIVMRKAKRSTLDRLADLGGPMWNGAAERLQQDRDEWNQ